MTKFLIVLVYKKILRTCNPSKKLPPLENVSQKYSRHMYPKDKDDYH